MLSELKSFIESLEKELGDGILLAVRIGFREELVIRISQLYNGNLFQTEHAFSKEALANYDEPGLMKHLKNATIQKILDERNK